jgi:hypothetical protein
MMVVCPAVPRAGEDVTDSVNPSTLPVAGRPDGAVDVVVDPLAVVVVEAELPELEHPATTGRARASRAAATGAVRWRSIGSSYRPPHPHLRMRGRCLGPGGDDRPVGFDRVE